MDLIIRLKNAIIGPMEQWRKNDYLKAQSFRIGGVASSVGAQSLVWGMKDIASNMNPQDVNPIVSGIAFHGGDYLNGFADAYFPYLAINYLFPKAHTTTKLATSSGISLGSILLAEIPQLQHVRPQFMGTADWWDIPAGVLGIAAFLAAEGAYSHFMKRDAISRNRRRGRYI